ncbi:hypothetical protein PCE1_004325 [Barthelona sp. PCE]
MNRASLPLMLLFETEGFEVFIELNNNESYRGVVARVQDNMNVVLKDPVHTLIDGSKEQLKSVFIRGSQIKFISIPEMLVNSPVFQMNNNQRLGIRRHIQPIKKNR